MRDGKSADSAIGGVPHHSHECSLLEQQKRETLEIVSLNRRHAFRFIDRTFSNLCVCVYVYNVERYLTMPFDEC